MQVSEVRIKIVENNNDRLKAFCSLTFDDMFVVRDLKIIEGANGIFVAMPSRKLTDHCPSCRAKNHIRSKYCNDCGERLGAMSRDRNGQRIKLHADIAHPINAQCREVIQTAVLQAYDEEYERSQQPGYISPSLDFEDDYVDFSHNYDPDQDRSSQPETVHSEQDRIVEIQHEPGKDGSRKPERKNFSDGIL